MDLRDVFAKDPARSVRFARELVVGTDALYVDFSKQLITDEVFGAFIDVLEANKVADNRDAMFAGDHVNTTEDLPALHTALRAPRGRQVLVDGVDVAVEVHRVLDELSLFAERIARGVIRGATGKPFTNVVNIGIGGSDLGPALVYDALATMQTPKLACSFVSNMDATNLISELASLDAKCTLVVICSKTFSTAETVANARLIQQWLTASLGEAGAAQHCVVVSAKHERAERAGIRAAYSFPMWEWVGGRYSVSSAVSTAIVVAFGGEVFREFLDGMHAMDQHFVTAPIADNLPMLLAMLDVWNTSVHHMQTHAVLPYATALQLFPAYLQQLEMESNGKRVTRDGLAVSVNTSPVVWGGVGTNAQHAFMQLIHQGTAVVPVDFIAFSRPAHRHLAEHDALVANVIAQSKALAFGRTASDLSSDGTDQDLVAHLVMPGNRPSTVIFGTELTPAMLGVLIALYEHKVFVSGCLWGINSFDQWGVELGKVLATDIIDDLAIGKIRDDQDSSTSQLMKWYVGHRKHS